MAERRHRVGLGWRPDLAAGVLTHLDRIDVVEVIADNYFRAAPRELSALRALAAQVPVHLHGVGLGLASACAVDDSRLDAMARLIEQVRPAMWSEHLAFVRAGGIEIGHLAMPPRTDRTIEQTVRNIGRACAITGMMPALENIATLFDPPMSTHSEGAWTRRIIEASGAHLLLDLHNLYANAVNAGRDPLVDLAGFPLQAVRAVHLSGGLWVKHANGTRRLLDDHLHSPPDELFALLRSLAGCTSQALDVVVERDGNFPSFDVLLAELRRTRDALAIAAPVIEERRRHA